MRNLHMTTRIAAMGDVLESEKEAITRKHGVGRAIDARESTAFLGETIAIIRHKPKSTYGPLICKTYNTLAMPGSAILTAIADLTTLATLVISGEEEGRSLVVSTPTAYFSLALCDDTALRGSSRLQGNKRPFQVSRELDIPRTAILTSCRDGLWPRRGVGGLEQQWTGPASGLPMYQAVLVRGKACCGPKRWYLFVLLVVLAGIAAISVPSSSGNLQQLTWFPALGSQ